MNRITREDHLTDAEATQRQLERDQALRDFPRAYPYADHFVKFQTALSELLMDERERSRDNTVEAAMKAHDATVRVLAIYNELLTKCQAAKIEL
jgi:predicted kinase